MSQTPTTTEPWLREILRCPQCKGELTDVTDAAPEAASTPASGVTELQCPACGLGYPIESGVPVLPLAVHGAATALRKHDWRFGRSTAEVRVLEPISTEGMTLDDVPALREQARERIIAELKDMGRNFDEPTERA